MGTITEKLTYTRNAVNEIYSAVIEKGGDITNATPLNQIAQKIRDLHTGTPDYLIMLPRGKTIPGMGTFMDLNIISTKPLRLSSNTGVIFFNNLLGLLNLEAGEHLIECWTQANITQATKTIQITAKSLDNELTSETILTQPSPETTYMILAGKVTNESGQGLFQVVISVNMPAGQPSAMTDTNGNYSIAITGYLDFSFALFNRTGYFPAYKTFKTAGQTNNQNLIMQPTGTISLTSMVPAVFYNQLYGDDVPEGYMVDMSNHVWILADYRQVKFGVTKRYLKLRNINSVEEVKCLYQIGYSPYVGDNIFTIKCNGVINEVRSCVGGGKITLIYSYVQTNPQYLLDDPYGNGRLCEIGSN